LDDSTIMATLGQDEELWFSQVIDRYTAYVTAIISGISKGALSASDIEEVAADVFFKLWQKRKQIRGDSMKAFIAKLARNASIDMMRKQGEPLVPYDDDILQVSYHEQPDELAILREQKQIIEQAVDAFGEPEREIFIRFYYFGETIKTISERLQMNAATTKTKLHRLRSKLTDIMQERGYCCE
jgi:RNA polymerase sigma-70 factor (ECF subfamily)